MTRDAKVRSEAQDIFFSFFDVFVNHRYFLLVLNEMWTDRKMHLVG